MARLEDLAPNARTALADHVGRLKHDLGKYVAMQTRWVAPDAPLDQRRGALIEDLTRTRRGPDGESDAVAVWAAFRPELAAIADDPDLVAVDAAMTEIATVIAAIRAGTIDDATVRRGAAAAISASDGCQRLHRRARGA